MAKILVVDDDANISRAMQLALETGGHEVVTASSKEEGEAAAVAAKPDLMIVDVMMPEGTEGFHLVWKIRHMDDEALKNVPIMMVTGIHQTTEMRFYPDQSDGTYEPGEFLPVQGWIDKPVKPDQLLSKVSELLQA
jgi:twitching motility two-component system response regulator PilH